MQKIKFRKAIKSDMSIIKQAIKKSRMDDENLDYSQFIIAEKNEKVVGFSRIKPYDDCYELGSVFIFEEYRNSGIGKKIWITTDYVEYFENKKSL